MAFSMDFDSSRLRLNHVEICDYVIHMKICLLATGKHGTVFVLPLWMPL